jgi:hypothetical protein
MYEDNTPQISAFHKIFIGFRGVCELFLTQYFWPYIRITDQAWDFNS